MGFKCGIIGLPNIGKSTLFNAITQASVPASNYPFCTIEPNIGIVAVPDARLQVLENHIQPQKVIPSTTEFIDIAGLVKGAAQGEGLGNQFLSHIRSVDAIVHVVRCFEQTDIIHTAGQVDPLSDIEIINTELALADLEMAEKASQRLTRISKTGDKTSKATIELLKTVMDHLNQGQLLRQLNLSQSTSTLLKPFQFITLKPTLYLANIDEQMGLQNPLLKQVQDLASREGIQVIPVCAKMEEDLNELSEADKKAFLADTGFQETGISRLIRTGYQLLGLQTFFTVGPKEVRAWTIQIGSTAVEAASRIHTDFAKGFIRAEIISYEDFIHYKDIQGAKDAGKWRLEGKSYLIQDGDIIYFRFNV